MKHLMLFSITCFTLVIFSCQKSDSKHELCAALESRDQSTAADWINHLAAELNPDPTSLDPVGHSVNLEQLIARLNRIDCIRAEIVCYACIETFPLKSQITLSTDNIQVVAFLKTSEDFPLKFVGWRLE